MNTDFWRQTLKDSLAAGIAVALFTLASRVLGHFLGDALREARKVPETVSLVGPAVGGSVRPAELGWKTNPLLPAKRPGQPFLCPLWKESPCAQCHWWVARTEKCAVVEGRIQDRFAGMNLADIRGVLLNEAELTNVCDTDTVS